MLQRSISTCVFHAVLKSNVLQGHAPALLNARAEKVDVMLSSPTADALHDPGNCVNFEPSENAGYRSLRLKGQRRDPC